MIRSITLHLTCLLAFAAAEPRDVTTGEFAARWETIPAPWQPLSLTGPAPHGHRYNGYASGQRPAGTFDIAYSLVDEAGNVTAPSPLIHLISTVRDWQVAVETPGLDPKTRAAGTMWWFRPMGTTAWQPLGAQLNAQLPWQVHRPFVPLVGWARHSLQAHELFQCVGFPGMSATGYWGKSKLAAPTVPPAVRLLAIDNVGFDVCYSWCCNEGETGLSPLTVVEPFTHPFDTTYKGPGFHAPFELARNIVPPQGALGMYVYLRPRGTRGWNRQPAPNGRGYLWPIDANRIEVQTFLHTGIPPGPSAGRSFLSPLHLALRDTTGDVIVGGDVTVCCPVISASEKPDGTQLANRTISKAGGGKWVLIDTGTVQAEPLVGGYPRDWPLWVENSYNTRLVGCHMVLDGSDCGIAFLDHHGGREAMHFRGTGISIQPNHNNRQPYTYGVRCLWHSRGWRASDHSASEPIFRDHHTAASFPVVVEGNQSANWVFDYATLTSTGAYNSAIITQGNAGTVMMAGRFTCDNARCLLAATTPAKLEVERLWLDQGFPCWVCVGACNGARLEIRGTKVNQWGSWFHVAESPCFGGAYAASEISVASLDSQGPAQEALACSPKPGSLVFDPAPRTPILRAWKDAAAPVVPVPIVPVP
jgi:hypothetical protein